MAAIRKDREKVTGNGWGDLQFAKWSWNQENDDAYEAWIKHHAPDGMEGLSYLVEQGYRVTLSFDHDSGSPKVSATGVGKKHVNENVCITSWGNDVEDCVLLTIFKIDILFEGKTAPTSTRSASGRR